MMETLAEYLAEHALVVVAALAFAVAGAISMAGLWISRHYLRLRTSPLAYLGLHVGTGFVLLIAAVATFGELLEDLREQDDVVQFDLLLIEALEQRTSTESLQIFAAITRLGDVSTITVLGVLVGAVLVWRHHRVACVAWAMTLLGGGLLNRLLKELIRRDRPDVTETVMTAAGWAFPSGHAMSATFTYGMAAYLLVRIGGFRWRMSAVMFTIALVLLVGASRIVLQVHYFSDVVAGFAAGLAWLIICITGTELALHRSGSSSR